MTVLVLVSTTGLSDLDGDKSWILPSSRLLCGVRWLETDVSGRPVGPTFKGEAFQDVSSWTSWPLKMGPIDTPETSVWNHLTARSNPEDGRIQFNRGGSLRYCRKGGVIGRAFGFTRWWRNEEEVCVCVRACVPFHWVSCPCYKVVNVTWVCYRKNDGVCRESRCSWSIAADKTVTNIGIPFQCTAPFGFQELTKYSNKNM